MAEQLLPEILVDIFLRLPIKTICQLVCVCKYWNSLITSPSFAKAHLNQPSQESLLLFQGYYGNPEDEFHIVHRDNAVFDKFAEFECPFKSSYCGYFRVIDCCNGVICSTDDQETYIHHTFLWNPSIKKCVVLPEPRVTFFTHGGYRHAIGFGYDETNNDYKVVRIVYLQNSKVCCPPEVDVYRLSSRTWHNITHLGLAYEIDKKAPQVYINEASHWLAYDKSKTRHLVVAFHMAEEVFRYIEAPKGMKFSTRNLLVPPGDCQRCLTLTECVGSWSHETWSVWVMKEYGVTDSWTKQFSVSGNHRFECLFGERGNGERIYDLEETGNVVCYFPQIDEWGTHKLYLERFLGFRETGEVIFGLPLGFVLAYHPQTKFKELELHVPKRPCCLLFATRYRESIALLGTKGHELQDQVETEMDFAILSSSETETESVEGDKETE